MTKRFPLELDENLHERFFRAYPNHGDRTNLLRKCIKRLIERAHLVQEPINAIADDALARVRLEKGRN